MKSTEFKIILGTYEGRIIVTKLDLSSLKASSFTFKVSDQSIKSFNNRDGHLFSSGTDEILRIFDVNKREDKGEVTTYNGTVNQITFVKDTILLSGGDDGQISIWNLEDFANLHVLKGHKKAVNSVAAHSEGRLMLSSANDFSVIVWNLEVGGKVLKHKFPSICNKIMFGEDKNKAILVFDKKYQIVNLDSGKDEFEEWLEKPVSSQLVKIFDSFILGSSLLLASSAGKLEYFKHYEKNEGKLIDLGIEENNRIKHFAARKIGGKNYLITVDKNNRIDVYVLSKLIKGEQDSCVKTIALKTVERVTAVHVLDA